MKYSVRKPRFDNGVGASVPQDHEAPYLDMKIENEAIEIVLKNLNDYIEASAHFEVDGCEDWARHLFDRACVIAEVLQVLGIRDFTREEPNCGSVVRAIDKKIKKRVKELSKPLYTPFWEA